MEAAVDTLQAQFSKANADLDLVSRRLEVSFADSLRAVSRDELNPISLLTRLDAVRNQMAELGVEREALDRELQASTSAVAALVAQNCQLVHALQVTVDQEPMAVDGDMSFVCGLAGVNLLPPRSRATHGVVSPPDSVTSMSRDDSVSSYDDLTSGSEVSSHQHQTSSDVGTSGTQAFFTGDPVAAHNQRYAKASTPASRRKEQPTVFLPVTNEEFMTVSTLVRRRAKLDGVNTVYKSLFDHFKVQSNKGALSTQKMTAMGLSIVGSTGQAKLKSLAALKLLHISKENSVKMP